MAQSKERGGSSVDGGYKMSISSNNAIDKLRQLPRLLRCGKRQKAAINENYVGREENGGDGIAGWPVKRVASSCSAMQHGVSRVADVATRGIQSKETLTRSCPAASTVK